MLMPANLPYKSGPIELITSKTDTISSGTGSTAITLLSDLWIDDIYSLTLAIGGTSAWEDDPAADVGDLTTATFFLQNSLTASASRPGQQFYQGRIHDTAASGATVNIEQDGSRQISVLHSLWRNVGTQGSSGVTGFYDVLGAGGGNAVPDSVGLTTTEDDTVIWQHVITKDTTISSAALSGFTIVTTHSVSGVSQVQAYKLQASAGTYSSATWSGINSTHYRHRAYAVVQRR